jgi:hypothetical protein
MYRLSAYLYGTVKARVPAEALIIRDLNSLETETGVRPDAILAIPKRLRNHSRIQRWRVTENPEIASLTPVSIWTALLSIGLPESACVLIQH